MRSPISHSTDDGQFSTTFILNSLHVILHRWQFLSTNDSHIFMYVNTFDTTIYAALIFFVLCVVLLFVSGVLCFLFSIVVNNVFFLLSFGNRLNEIKRTKIDPSHKRYVQNMTLLLFELCSCFSVEWFCVESHDKT